MLVAISVLACDYKIEPSKCFVQFNLKKIVLFGSNKVSGLPYILNNIVSTFYCSNKKNQGKKLNEKTEGLGHISRIFCSNLSPQEL